MLVHELHASWIKVHFSDLGARLVGCNSGTFMSHARLNIELSLSELLITLLVYSKYSENASLRPTVGLQATDLLPTHYQQSKTFPVEQSK